MDKRAKLGSHSVETALLSLSDSFFASTLKGAASAPVIDEILQSTNMKDISTKFVSDAIVLLERKLTTIFSEKMDKLKGFIFMLEEENIGLWTQLEDIRINLDGDIRINLDGICHVKLMSY